MDRDWLYGSSAYCLGLPKEIWVFSACTFAALFSPVLLLIWMAVWWRSKAAPFQGRWVVALGTITFLALFNATKRPESDWYWYVDGYSEVFRSGVSAYIEAGGLSIRGTEPIYYWFSWIMAVLSGGSVPILAIGITYLIYVPYVGAIERLFERLGLEDRLALSCLLFSLIAGLTFTLSLHLVRQYLAGTLLFLVYVWILDGRALRVALTLTVGILVHNSLLIPGGLLLICWLLWTSATIQRHIFKTVFTLFLLGFGIGTLASRWAMDSPLAQSAMKDDGGISAIVLLIDVGMFLAGFYWLWAKREVNGILEKETAVALLFLALFGGILFGTRDLTLFFLRFYFFVEWFRVIGLIALCRILARMWPKSVFPVTVCTLSLTLMHLRIERASWDYGGSLIDHLLGSMPWWIEQIGKGCWSIF